MALVPAPASTNFFVCVKVKAHHTSKLYLTIVYCSHRVNTKEVLCDKNFAEIPILSYFKEILQSMKEEHGVVIILTSIFTW